MTDSLLRPAVLGVVLIEERIFFKTADVKNQAIEIHPPYLWPIVYSVLCYLGLYTVFYVTWEGLQCTVWSALLWGIILK